MLKNFMNYVRKVPSKILIIGLGVGGRVCEMDVCVFDQRVCEMGV